MRRTPLARGTSQLRRVTRLRPRARVPKRRAREEATPEVVEFKIFCRSLPCCGCGDDGEPRDPHHAGHDHGVGERAHWSTQIPLCRRCHDDLHDGKTRYANQVVRRRWEVLAIEAVRGLWAAWKVNRLNGTMALSEESLLLFSIAWATAKKESK